MCISITYENLGMRNVKSLPRLNTTIHIHYTARIAIRLALGNLEEVL